MAISPPASWTFAVMRRWWRTFIGVAIRPPSGMRSPERVGVMPPVTMRPTPPRARSA
jgi:hypothetical protein